MEDFTNKFIKINHLDLPEDLTSLNVLLECLTTETIDLNNILAVANAVNNDLHNPGMLTIDTKIVFDVVLAALTNDDSDPEICVIYYKTVRDRSSLDISVRPDRRLWRTHPRTARVSLPVPSDVRVLNDSRSQACREFAQNETEFHELSGRFRS
jgi:hypothetical protein